MDALIIAAAALITAIAGWVRSVIAHNDNAAKITELQTLMCTKENCPDRIQSPPTDAPR